MSYRALLAALAIISLSACSPDYFSSAQEDVHGNEPEVLTGSVIIREDPSTGSLLAAVDVEPRSLGASPGLDRVFILQRTGEERLGRVIEIETATVRSASDAVVIQNTETAEVFALVLSEKRASIEAEVGAGEHVTLLSGYGLSRRQVTTDRTLASLRSEFPSEYNPSCTGSTKRGFFDHGSRFAAILIGPGEDNQQYCSSGGTGSTTCSSTCIGDEACSTSCEPGYYACCDNVRCTCTCTKKP